MFHSGKKLVLAALLAVLTVSSASAEDNILIAYFTWAENTVIIDRDKAIKDANGHVWSMERGDIVDTTTTASVLPPGNTPRIASWIQNRTGGDLFSIRVVDKYPCYWDEILDRASNEKARRARPELVEGVSNIADYDVIFLGFPNWWYTIPMAVATFVEAHDLSGKTIIPFVTHGTSGVSRTVRDLKRLLPSSVNLEKEIGVYRSRVTGSRGDVEAWLDSLGYRG